jgi:glutathione S-transferase
MKLYGDSRSGNCYKVQLLCAELGIEYEWREVDILAGETRTAEFLAMNANGRIPLLALGDGRYLPESNAILAFLADGNAIAGRDRYHRAQVLAWMFFEQYSHEPYIATSRFIIQYLGAPPEREADLQARKAPGIRALEILDRQLAGQDYLSGADFTIADIALFAYTHKADEGGFDLGPYASLRSWIDRIEARPLFVPMAVNRDQRVRDRPT